MRSLLVQFRQRTLRAYDGAAAHEDRRRRLTLAATVLGSSLAFIDASVVVVALPTIQRDLGFGLAGEQWVFLSYSLALAALYLPAGAVGDRGGAARRLPPASSASPSPRRWPARPQTEPCSSSPARSRASPEPS